jgi:hypothetical protein
MSLLGAKRPQHGVWQLIVATLAVVLAMPAATALLMRPGSLPDLHLLERCFMPLLVLVGWMNFAGTRRAAAVSCIAAAQLLLLRGFLPGMAMDGAMNAAAGGGSSREVARAMLLTEPPSLDAGEVTDKGSLNVRAIVTRRADALARLYDNDPEVLTP